MKDETNIEKLATLSRIFVSEEEQKTLKDDIDSILSYIEQIQDISSDKNTSNCDVKEHHNVMRKDGEPHKTGINTVSLLNEAPSVKNNYIEVKKIID